MLTAFSLLYLILFLHQTTTTQTISDLKRRCILFSSYIKPQRIIFSCSSQRVVSYSLPTSNHNSAIVSDVGMSLYLILFLHQTTTLYGPNRIVIGLYLILFLHQTTTEYDEGGDMPPLYLILFLHQTTTNRFDWFNPACCILFSSYIKPQLTIPNPFGVSVVSYSLPTSNHNWSHPYGIIGELYLILFLHQTTTITQLR